jgi:hypothetical protein
MLPEHLFNTLKLIHPDLKSISKTEWDNYVDSESPFNTGTTVVIEWGDTDEYPVQNNWRTATINDIQDPPLKARFRKNAKHPQHEGYLTGLIRTVNSLTWLDEDEDEYAFCEVIANDDLVGAKPISTYPNSPNTHWLYMGGKWITGLRSRDGELFYSDGETCIWDESNQPTHWKPYNE